MADESRSAGRSELVADGIPSYKSATDALAASGHPHLCGDNRQSDYRLCLVYADGVLALISFDNPQETVARIAGDGLGGEVTVPIDGSQMIGFASSGGQIRLIVERDGQHAGSGMGMGTNPETESPSKGKAMNPEQRRHAGRTAKAHPAMFLVAVCLLLVACDGGADLEVPEGALELPDDHLAAQLLADNASPEEVSSAAVMCTQGGSAAGPHSTCLIDDDGLLVLLPLSMPSDIEAVITGTAFGREFKVPLPTASGGSLPTADDLFAIPHEMGDMKIELYHNGEPAGAEFSGPLG